MKEIVIVCIVAFVAVSVTGAIQSVRRTIPEWRYHNAVLSANAIREHMKTYTGPESTYIELSEMFESR